MAPADPRRCQWIVLGEDTRHLNFVYHWLRARGVAGGKIRKQPVPAGSGAGEQSVRRRYAAELRSLRSHNYLLAALVVVIDADTGTVDDRVAELAAELPREPRDRVALAIPRRNIETWIHHLLAPPADEETDYKRLHSDDDVRVAAQRLGGLRSPPGNAPDSLRRFFAEIARVLS